MRLSYFKISNNQIIKKKLHIIAFNIPAPPNYGGVIDVFYKIKALKKAGVGVILHCFEYNRPPNSVLNQYCDAVYYYKRNTSIVKQFHTLPYIVNSRQSKVLVKRLLKDDYPILFEGLHTCYELNNLQLQHRHKMVRMHNVEWQYYAHLGRIEKKLIKRLFFKLESWRLKQFEPKLKYANTIISISPLDQVYLENRFQNVQYIPAFHSNETVQSIEGKGEYALFHGDLSVKDNELAVIYLIEQVFKTLPFPLIIAGLNPTQKLQNCIEQHENVTLQANLPYKVLQQLIQNAHINILISFHSAGMKLKLLNALYNGRFCIVNTAMVKSTGLEKLCLVGNKPSSLQALIKTSFQTAFTTKKIEERKILLEAQFSNTTQGLKLSQLF